MKKKPPPRHLSHRLPRPVRPVGASLIRIVLLACVALAGAIFALVLHYRMRQRPWPSPDPAAAIDAGELQAPELLPMESSSAPP